MKIKISYVIIFFLLLIIGGGITNYFVSRKIHSLENKLTEQNNINAALNDTLHIYINKYNEITTEKTTIQANLETIKKRNNELTKNQKELITRIHKLTNEKNIIAAALVESQIKIDSLFSHTKPIIDTLGNKITFIKSDTNIYYNITTFNVKPIIKLTSYLSINSLIIPNKQFIDFHWKDNKHYKQYPISFSITNSNPYVQTLNADSYIIPEINKRLLKPKGWDNIKFFFNNNKKTVFWSAIGFLAGSIVF